MIFRSTGQLTLLGRGTRKSMYMRRQREYVCIELKNANTYVPMPQADNQVILTVLQLGFTVTFEHIDAGNYLYIICAKGRTYLAKHILLHLTQTDTFVGDPF